MKQIQVGNEIIEFPADMPDAEIEAVLAKNFPAPKSGPTALQQSFDTLPSFARVLGGVGESGLQAVTGLGASVAGGLAGLADAGLSSAGVGSGSPGDTVRKVQQFATYQPRTEQGRKASEILGLPMQLYSDAVHAAGNAVRGDNSGGTRDFLGTTVDVVGEGLPAVLGGSAALRATRKATPAPLTPEQTVLAGAQKEGYTIPPSLIGRRSWLEGVGGKARTAQTHSANNAEVTNRLAVRELQLPEGTNLTPELLQNYRNRLYQDGYVPLKQRGALAADDAYLSEVSALPARTEAITKSFPDAKVAGAQEVSALADGLFVPRMTYEAAVEQVRQLRFESKRNLKSFDDPSKVSLGMAQKSAAQALEGLIERNLATTGDQAALSKFRLAREHIAKSHTVEEAMNPVTGAVHARDLAKSKAPLTGGLKTAADFATAFPRATQKLESFGGTPPFSPLDVSMGTAAGLMGSVASGSPSGLLAAGIPMVRPYAAPVTTRPFVQQGLLRNPVPIQPEVGLLPLFDPTLDRRLR